jgi:hypothetical protein
MVNVTSEYPKIANKNAEGIQQNGKEHEEYLSTGIFADNTNLRVKLSLHYIHL